MATHFDNNAYDAVRKAAYRSETPYTGGEMSGRKDLEPSLMENLGTRRVPKVSNVRFPDADPIVSKFTKEYQTYNVDVLLVLSLIHI